MHYDGFSYSVLLSDTFATLDIFIAHVSLLANIFGKNIVPTQLP